MQEIDIILCEQRERVMTIYWTLGSIPELKQLSPSMRRQVWRACSKNCFRHWQTWVGLLICGLVAGSGTLIASQISKTAGANFTVWWWLIVVAIGGGIGGFIFGQIATAQTRPYLRAYIETMSSSNAEP